MNKACNKQGTSVATVTDYLIGEETQDFAMAAIDAALITLLRAKQPVFSINGNVAALVAPEIVELARQVGAAVEVNIFHASADREAAIANHLEHAGADTVLRPDPTCVLPGMEHNRRFVNPAGIATADVIFVPLEDGDRCEALVQTGKTVITVDLNPASRTARTAQISIVDNIMRVVRVMLDRLPGVQAMADHMQTTLVETYDNGAQLQAARQRIVSTFGVS